MAAFKLGEETSGRTAGKGRDGAGEAERRIAGDVWEPKDERLLEAVGGGSMGRGVVKGVPGLEGAGEAMARPLALADEARCVMFTSTGAGLCVDILRPGKSSLLNFPCVWRVQVPSLSFNA